MNYQLFSIEMSCLNARDLRTLLLVISMQQPLKSHSAVMEAVQ